MKSKILKGNIFAVTTLFAWDFTYVVGKFLLKELEPVQILLFRFVLVSLLGAVLNINEYHKKTLKEEAKFILVGFLVFLYFILENNGLKLTTASNIGFILGTLPFFSSITAHFFTKDEKITKELIVGFIIYTLVKKSLYVKKIKKEDRLYYFDAMTNLKNRNYLNDNIDFWSGTKVYPQAIVVIDINKLKLLNDRKGHEAGDNQIKAVANVLIKTQRDNSEIMRTDGDEFMIYLVGYDEKKIGSYIHKLNRELLSSLPHKDYGVSIGYSMITNEQTTIDDAINDSLLMIKKSKGNA